MSAATSPLQLEANRNNALLSTGPRTEEGKAASSRNAQSHGLTSRSAYLKGEDPAEYQQHHATYVAYYHPEHTLDRDKVRELADLNWRLRRVPAFEAQLLDNECNDLTTNPELQPLIAHLGSDERAILGLAFNRLVERRVLTNLFHQEARLARRAEKLERSLEALVEVHRRREAAKKAGPPRPMANFKIEAISEPPHPEQTAVEPGRNQPCTCGSGKKFKHCCWLAAPSR